MNDDAVIPVFTALNERVGAVEAIRVHVALLRKIERHSLAADDHTVPRFVGLSASPPVAILATIMAAPITSPGRFSPRGPLGIVSFQSRHCVL